MSLLSYFVLKPGLWFLTIGDSRNPSNTEDLYRCGMCCSEIFYLRVHTSPHPISVFIHSTEEDLEACNLLYKITRGPKL